MARIHLLWQHWRNGAELDISPATGLPRLSWWAGPGTDELARLLVASATEADGAQWTHGQDNSITLTLDRSRLELRGPASDQPVKYGSEESRIYQQRYRYSNTVTSRQTIPV